MKLTFYGGAGSVTGANYMLESGGEKILVDCGLHQGGNFAERVNFEPFPYDPKDVGAVFITHAHIDHIGLLPKLWRDGFRGEVFSTAPTKDCAELLLLDSEHLLSKEAEREGMMPLYSVQDINELLYGWKALEYHQKFKFGNFSVTYFDAGHILGSGIIRIEVEGKVFVFSGDLGNSPAPIIRDTEDVFGADYLLVESAYGNRVHEGVDKRQELLERAITDTINRKGVLLVPAFAMERTQDLLYHLNDLSETGKIPRIPVFIDSPLAIKLTRVYQKYEKYFDEEARRLIKSGEDIFDFPGLKFALTTEQSKEINNVPQPKVIIAGSGMSNGGRILHHEQRYLSDPESMILFVGYQTTGSLGRRILEGADRVRIMGVEVAVRCEVRQLSGYSAHADQPRILDWVSRMKPTLKKVFVVQGEEEASEVLARKIEDDLHINAEVPQPKEEFVVEYEKVANKLSRHEK